MAGGVEVSRTTYELTLKTLGPVHIGSGETLTKIDYIFNPFNSRVQFVNQRKLLDFLTENNLLEKFMNEIKFNNKKQFNLQVFFAENKIPGRLFSSIFDYSIPAYVKRNNKLNYIDKFIRDGKKELYLPGSSLKGALRSVFTSNIYNTEKEKEILRKIKVEDSSPISTESFSVYQKYDLNKNLEARPLFRECLRPDQTIKVRVIIEDSVLSLSEIEERIYEHFNNIYQKWMMGFKDRGMKKNQKVLNLLTKLEPNKDRLILLLGGGVGFADKTIYYQNYSKIEAKKKILAKLKKRHPFHYRKINKMPNNVPLALKLTMDTKGNIHYMFGPCEISFEKVDEY